MSDNYPSSAGQSVSSNDGNILDGGGGLAMLGVTQGSFDIKSALVV